MRFFLLYFLFLFITSPVWAEPATTNSMKHMQVTQPAPDPVQKKEITPAPEKTSPLPEEDKTAPQLEPEKETTKENYFMPLEKTAPWAMMDEIISENKEQQQIAINAAEKDASIVPPMGLLFVSKRLAAQNKIDDAALFFFLAQLRAQFDAKRLSRKTPDVAFIQSSQGTGTRVTKWLLADSNRIKRLMERLSVMEAQTAYAYDPGFNSQNPQPMEEWEKLRARVENDVMLMLQSLAGVTE
ncbi:MAG: hypothetical protein GC136_03240 [Alphaproteobacteria bacterium]|nr:hypothetical protein [Alphaproteobacteria bacterium]